MDLAIKRLCTICARGGSKGVKAKNVRLLHNKPLIAHSIEQALASDLFDCIAISSDSDEILDIGSKYGSDCQIKRPKALATDKAPKLPAIQHCVAKVEKMTGQVFDTLVDLDATSPLRTIQDIKGAVKLLETSDADNVITGMPSRRSPYFNLVELDENGYIHLSKPTQLTIERRQDGPKCFDMNASIYAWKRATLFDSITIFNKKTRIYVMPEERSIDIDSELDFRLVEFLIGL